MERNKTRLYIQAATQISMQEPLSEAWMEAPIDHTAPFVPALDPVFRDYIAPKDLRRMGLLMRRALVVSLKVLDTVGITHPDAIITGTSFGSLDYTERFLSDMTANGEQTLSPTYFMQSTHNTVGSALAIHTKTHGYNTTYSHGSVSFDLALLDAWMQAQMGKISNALVGGYDEMVESYFELLRKTGYVGTDGMVPCGEVAVSMLLTTENRPNNLCELAGIRIGNRPTVGKLCTQLEELLRETGMTIDEVSAVMTGINGNETNDLRYAEVVDALFPGKPTYYYKHLFGENHTASAFGIYAAAHCLQRAFLPAKLCFSSPKAMLYDPQSIALLNLTDGGEYSLIILKKI